MNTKVIGWISILLFAAFCFFSVQRSSVYQQCTAKKTEQATHQKQNERHSTFMIYVDCLGDFAHENHGPITAVFTVVLAVSTILLWGSTRETALVARSALTEIERAFVSYHFNVVAEVTKVVGVVDRWQIVPSWKNSGSTPAKQVFTHVSWDHFGHEIDPEFTFPDISNTADKNTMSFIAPNDDITTDGPIIDSALLEAVSMGWIKMYMWGWVEYDDVFKGSSPHRTEFCNEILFNGDPYAMPVKGMPGGGPLRLKIYPRHTGADEGCYRQARPAHLRAALFV